MKRLVPLVVVAAVLAGCGGSTAATSTAASSATNSISPVTTVTPTPTSAATPATTTAPSTTAQPTTSTTISPFARPDWLGTQVLPLGPGGKHGIAQPTPPELQDRRFETIDRLPPPLDDQFVSTVGPVPDDVIARSTWTEDCPVARDELRYVTVSHVGFDGRFHTGELIVNATVAEDVVGVFEKLHDAGFPIEQLKVTTQEELDAPPTGDGNGSGAYGCRPAVGSSGWSMHAFGLAIDINPFHNPYIKGELIIPELAMSYLDRERVLPGMVVDGGVVVEAFSEIGWEWGGDWSSLKDWMHFSYNGR